MMAVVGTVGWQRGNNVDNASCIFSLLWSEIVAETTWLLSSPLLSRQEQAWPWAFYSLKTGGVIVSEIIDLDS